MKILLHVEGERVISARVIGQRVKRINGLDKAKKTIQEMLKFGPRSSLEMFSEAKSAKISRDKFYAAAKELGILKSPIGRRAKDGWAWELPKNDKQTNVAHEPSGDAGDLDEQAQRKAFFASRYDVTDWKESS